MGPTIASRDAEHEIATIRCLLAQQIHILESSERGAPEHRSADRLMRQLLSRDFDLRARLDERAASPARTGSHDGA